MYKIAILGCENSHAKSFLELIKQGEYPALQVVGVYSEEREAADALHEAYGVAVLDDYASLAGRVDGIMITARHGDNHYRYAKPYLPYRIPMFIDKPITCREEDARAFMCEARENGVRLCGGSTCAAVDETLALAADVANNAYGELRGGALACPIYKGSPYGGFYFYAQHLVEVMTRIFGEGIQAIRADQNGETVTFTARYDGYSVLATYIEDSGYYSVSVYGARGARTEQLSISLPSFRHEMNDFLALLEGADMPKSYESFAYPVFVMNAILRSLDSGTWEAVAPMERSSAC